jgi:hypothetical protein
MKTRFNPQGRCVVCSGGWLCVNCQNDNAKQDYAQFNTMKRASDGIKAQRIARLCALYEIESDEGGTREHKAQKLLSIH